MDHKYKVELADDKSYIIELKEDTLRMNNEPVSTDIAKTGKDEWNVIRDHQSFNIKLLEFDKSAKVIKLRVNEEVFTLSIKNKLDLLLNEMGMSLGQGAKMKDIKAPMPGLVLEVLASAGQQVSAGDPLIILEAMKMENIIKATGDGTVKNVLVKNQDTVEKNQLLMEME